MQVKEKIEVSKFIRKMRKHKGLTQSQLANLMGTSQVKISQIETSKNTELKDYLNILEKLIQGHLTKGKGR